MAFLIMSGGQLAASPNLRPPLIVEVSGNRPPPFQTVADRLKACNIQFVPAKNHRKEVRLGHRWVTLITSIDEAISVYSRKSGFKKYPYVVTVMANIATVPSAANGSRWTLHSKGWQTQTLRYEDQQIAHTHAEALRIAMKGVNLFCDDWLHRSGKFGSQ